MQIKEMKNCYGDKEQNKKAGTEWGGRSNLQVGLTGIFEKMVFESIPERDMALSHAVIWAEERTNTKCPGKKKCGITSGCGGSF